MKKKILVADDETELLEECAFFLEQEGYEVLKAANGIQALKTAKEKDLQLILLDISMPQMNGMEVLWELRRDAATARVPVIMVTAHGGTGNIFQAQKMNAVDFLIKPFKVEELLEVVQKNIQ